MWAMSDEAFEDEEEYLFYVEDFQNGDGEN